MGLCATAGSGSSSSPAEWVKAVAKKTAACVRHLRAQLLGVGMPRPSSAQPPLWSSWDGHTYGKHFHGRELTVFSMPKQAGASTTYRNDYPEPPLYWKHAPKPDHSKRPVGDFPHTTSHRNDFQPHKVGGGAAILRPYPEQRYHPKLSAVTTARDSYQQPKLPPARPRTAQVAYSTTDLPMGTTTMRDDYQQWKIPSRHNVHQPHNSKPTKFHGTTTTRSDYNWPAEIPPPPAMYQARTDNRPVPNFEGTTEYRVSYAAVQLPMGMPADIGLQVTAPPWALLLPCSVFPPPFHYSLARPSSLPRRWLPKPTKQAELAVSLS